MAESFITKRAIADSLRALTREKSFDKISVKDISEKCGINRQTFYYHFTDKFDLLEWIYQTDIFDKTMGDIDFENWEIKLCRALDAMKKDSYFYINTINHTENYIQQYMISQTQSVFQKAIDILDERRMVDSEQRAFIARFFAYGICGMIIEWVSGGMKQEPAYVARNMRKLQIICERAAYNYVTGEMYEKLTLE